MSGLPAVTVIGTLVADPELRFTPAGAAVVNFTIAANSRRLNKDSGEWEDGDATFLRCNLWRDAAENVAESLTKGARVLATGALKQRDYETREGEKRTVMELEVDEVGPSLRWARAVVTKTKGGNGGGGGNSRSSSSGGNAGNTRGASSNRRPADDPWGSAPPASSGPVDDEPPF
jgi:single-strand DNA-binding protein